MKPYKKETKIPLRNEISYWLHWIAIVGAIILFFALSSCAISKPQNSPQTWTVVSTTDTDFRAKWGREYATFNKIPTDSVWVGKKITVSRGIK